VEIAHVTRALNRRAAGNEAHARGELRTLSAEVRHFF
jgi:hypothetical protein